MIIRRTLAEVTSHREKEARILGISPRALHYKLHRYGISDEDAHSDADAHTEELGIAFLVAPLNTGSARQEMRWRRALAVTGERVRLGLKAAAR